MSVEKKFLKYVTYDTQSEEASQSSPSTAKQLVLADVLKEELEALGLDSVKRDEFGIVYGLLKSNTDKQRPAIGLIAHMDTAAELTGKDVKPRVIENWNGETIQLNEEYSMSPKDFPELARAVGDTIIVTDGNTLLGADDKAGIAIIMQTLEELVKSNAPHGDVWVSFTPDEEIGRGVHNFDLKEFPADFAYTIDGGAVNHVDYETFNAAQAVVTIHGKSIHPGSAKNQMINAGQAACQFAMLLPQAMTPPYTSHREGFIHLISVEGICEEAKLVFILRDHEKPLLQAKKNLIYKARDLINAQYGEICHVDIHDTYENMRDYMNGDTRALDKAKAAIQAMGMVPEHEALRGGTDGSQLSARGLFTPNLGTGGGNCHGRFEYASVDKMKTMVEILHHILED